MDHPRISLERDRWAIAMGFLLIPAIAWADVITPAEFGFEALYLLAIALVTWYGGRRLGAVSALAALLAWSFAEYTTGHGYSNLSYFAWAVANHAAIYSLAVLSLGWLRNALRRLKSSNEALNHALSEVKELKGLLPVCAWCGRVRDDQGYWDTLETYITSHTHAAISHGICPQCRMEHFPEVHPDTSEVPAA